jgi:hypothetical protein
MTEQEFRFRILRAETLRGLSGRPSYYEGYVRGLRRHYHGHRFGTAEEHRKWLGMVGDLDEAMLDRGRGYRDGYQGKNLSMEPSDGEVA